VVSQFQEFMQEELLTLKEATDAWLAAVAAGSDLAVDDVMNQIAAVESAEKAMAGVGEFAGAASSVVKEYKVAMEAGKEKAMSAGAKTASQRPTEATLERDRKLREEFGTPVGGTKEALLPKAPPGVTSMVESMEEELSSTMGSMEEYYDEQDFEIQSQMAAEASAACGASEEAARHAVVAAC
jgi:hypothetical protein